MSPADLKTAATKIFNGKSADNSNQAKVKANVSAALLQGDHRDHLRALNAEHLAALAAAPAAAAAAAEAEEEGEEEGEQADEAI